jgi:hypothetical protein
LLPAAAGVGGADDSARPLRAAQFTKPNMARARIGTAFLLQVFSVPSALKASHYSGKNL